MIPAWRSVLAKHKRLGPSQLCSPTPLRRHRQRIWLETRLVVQVSVGMVAPDLVSTTWDSDDATAVREVQYQPVAPRCSLLTEKQLGVRRSVRR